MIHFLQVRQVKLFKSGPKPSLRSRFPRFWLMLKGRIEIQCAGMPYSADRSGILILPPGLKLSSIDISGELIETLYDPPTEKSGQLKEPWKKFHSFINYSEKSPLMIPIHNQNKFTRYAVELYQEHNGSRFVKSIKQSLILNSLLAEALSSRIFNNSSRQTNRKIQKNIDTVNQITRFIKKNYFSDICIDNIYEQFDLHPNYLRNIFKDHIGISARKYLLNTRLEEAGKLLVQGKLTVKEISHRVGFQNEKFFYTAFKKNVGITPTEFKKTRKT